MQKLLFQYLNYDEALVLKNYLETRLPYEVLLSGFKKETEDLIASRAIHLIVYEAKEFLAKDLQFTKDLRNSGYSYPILSIADSIGIEEIAVMLEKNKTYILEKPFEFKALAGLCRKLMTLRQVPQQRHRRFKTNQRTLVETYLSGEAVDSHMFNLSVGGAYFEFAKRPAVGVGDIVRMKITLPDVEREYAVNGRIIWTTHKGMHSGGHGCGVMFVKGNDIYRQLMDKV